MKPAAVQSTKVRDVRWLVDEPVLAYIDADGLDKHLSTHGMYPPAAAARQGVAAFGVRPDVTLGDVLETVSSLLRQADAVASAIACDANAEPDHANAADAISHLLQQARGLHSLVLPVVGRSVAAGSAPSVPKGWADGA